jgi:hypothetical protein
VPAVEQGILTDLVAELFSSRRRLPRLGTARLLGADEVESARSTNERLLVFDSAFNWLKGHCLGAVILDWKHAGYDLDGVRTICCKASVAPLVHAATRRCWPPPEIFVPYPTGERHAT